MIGLPFGLLPTDVQKQRGVIPSPQPERKGRIQQAIPFLGYLLGRVLAAFVTFLIVTAVVYAISLLVPADDRARLYLPERLRYEDAGAIRLYLDKAIEQYGLDDPFPAQYGRWLGSLARGDWGTSALLRQDVLTVILLRSPATLELTLFAILIYIPLGLLLGAYIAWKQGQLADRIIRTASFAVTAIPPFVMGFVLIAVVYVQMHLLDLSRIGYAEKAIIQGDEFWPLTGLIVFDGMLNLRFDIVWQAIRHLIMPVSTLVAYYLASLILVTRASVTEELQKEYVLLAKGLGLKDSRILFTYALRNAMLPGLTHSALTAAQLVTGVYVVEAIFNWHGISDVLLQSMGSGIPDVSLALGFCVYSVIVVLSIALIIDIGQGLVDPRIRLGSD